jgi:hypothetical protein
MPTAPHSFKRLVLGLQPSAPNRSVRLAVALAELLNLELLGLFLEDSSLRDFAGLPFARELRLLGDGWHPIDLERLSHDLELSARSAERMFTEAAKHLSTRWQFEVKQGTMATTITAISQTGDIVMVIEPASAAERASQPFSGLFQAAFRSVAAVMIVPTDIARTRGAIAVIASALDDPSVGAAADIALAAEENLVVVDIGEKVIDDEHVRALSATRGLPIKHTVADKTAHSDPAALAKALGSLQERLVVMTRGIIDDRAIALLASQRRVPVLVVEPSALAEVAMPAAGGGR